MNTNSIKAPAGTPIMFVRDTGDTFSHISTGWEAPAVCGAKPFARSLGWTLGATSAFLADLTVCPDCQRAYSAQMQVGR